jgi:hypothetical protein
MFEILVDNTVKEKNKKEWERINNLWLEVKNNNKFQNPDLYDTESDNSDDCSKPCKELKRADSSYDELLFAHDCIITEKNEIECDTPIYDGIEDSKTHFTSSSTDDDNYNDNDNDNDNDTESSYTITLNEIKTKYNLKNVDMLELDYSMNYNMKMLTHLASYYNIIKNNNNGLGVGVSKSKDNKPKKTKKLLKHELIKEIILFETNYDNHNTVLKFRKMLEKIDALKKDKYFSSFILFS